MSSSPTSEARIGYVLKMYPRFSETFIMGEILELERQGAKVHIYSLKKPDDGRFHADLSKVRAPVTYAPDSLAMNPARLAGIHSAAAQAAPWAYARRLATAAKRRRWGALKRLTQAAYLAPRVRADGITHLHAHFASSATTVAAHLGDLTGIPYSLTAHAKDIYHQQVSHRSLSRKLSGARFAVTVSDFNCRTLAPLSGGTPLVRIYNGLDLERFRPNGTRPDTVPLVLGVGRLVEKKGFADLLRACAILRSQGVDFRCLIVGKGGQGASLRRLVLDLGLEGIVALPGPLPREALLDLYPRATVLAAPCIVGADGNRDGLPTVLIEAMAMGVPVVATPVTGIPELVRHEDTGLLVPEGRPEALAAALARQLEDREAAAAMAGRGRRLVEQQFDLAQNVRQLHQLLVGEAVS